MHATGIDGIERGFLAHGRVHLLGAGGAGVSGAAQLLLARGFGLSGHDRAPSAFSRALENLGVAVEYGTSEARHLPTDAELVVRSAAVPADDPQVVAAVERGLAVLKYSQLVGQLAPSGRTAAVAGTHGKTTTSWMLWHALDGIARGSALPKPGALIGGRSARLCTNAVANEPGGWFAVEACEYDRSFLALAPTGVALTNVEADHLDYYGTLDALEAAFARFVASVPAKGLVVAGREVPARILAASRAPVWRMGAELETILLGEERGRFRFRLRGPGWATPPVTLAVPGAFNVENAALALALAVGLSEQNDRRLAAGAIAADAAAGLTEFSGVERRFETWFESGAPGASRTVVHDYAHHPTEVRATLEAARRAFPGHALHVLFQPHQHSRTARCLGDFVQALVGVERVVVADVYGARVPRLHGAEGAPCAGAPELVDGLRRAHVDARAGGQVDAAAHLAAAALAGQSGDVALLVLGAGDIDGTRELFERELAVRGPAQRIPR